MFEINPQNVLTGGLMFLCAIILGARLNFIRFKRKSEKSVTKINNELMVAIGEASVRGRRPTMEDEVFIDLDICQDEIQTDIDQQARLIAFGVLDGHCGKEVATIGRALISRYIVAHKECFSKSPEIAAAGVTRAIIDLDQTTQLKQGGSTINFSLINSDGYLMNVNAGDSRAVLIRNFKAIPLSIDHKPSRESEKKRIERVGGEVHPTQLVRSGCVLNVGPDRVWPGGLSVSRGLGDWHVKNLQKVKQLINQMGQTFDPFNMLYKQEDHQIQENKQQNTDIVVEDINDLKDQDTNQTPQESFSTTSTTQQLDESKKLQQIDPDVEEYIITDNKKEKISFEEDAELKNTVISQLICSVPEIHYIKLDQECQLVVCACDGLYDVITNADIARIAEENMHKFMNHAVEQVAIRNIEQCIPENNDGDINQPNMIGKSYGALSKAIARLKYSVLHLKKDYQLPESLLQQADYICASMLAQKYVDIALQRQSSDNISCVVCIFRWKSNPQNCYEWESESSDGNMLSSIKKIFQKRQKIEQRADYEESELKATRIISGIDPSREWM